MFLLVYICCWVSACVLAVILFFRVKSACSISKKDYWLFLFAPWKLVTFLIATTGLTIIAPYSGDYTWDYIDAIFMSVLTYATASWVIGVLFKAAKRELPLAQVYIAVCMWMFSASWSYDLYILLRDGNYPPIWFYNIFASSVLYISAGLFWNLEWIKGRGVIFAFMQKDWPGSPPKK